MYYFDHQPLGWEITTRGGYRLGSIMPKIYLKLHIVSVGRKPASGVTFVSPYFAVHRLHDICRRINIGHVSKCIQKPGNTTLTYFGLGYRLVQTFQNVDGRPKTARKINL